MVEFGRIVVNLVGEARDSYPSNWLCFGQLIGTFKRTRAAPTLLITPSVPPSPQSVSIPDRLKPALGHYPGKMEKARRCAVRAKRAQSLDYCERCNQALCAYPYFKRYHILQNYKIPCDVPKPPTSQKSSMPGWWGKEVEVYKSSPTRSDLSSCTVTNEVP